MTWKELAENISVLAREQQDMDVTVLCARCTEFYEATFHINHDNTSSVVLQEHLDVLDAYHPVLVSKHE